MVKATVDEKLAWLVSCQFIEDHLGLGEHTARDGAAELGLSEGEALDLWLGAQNRPLLIARLRERYCQSMGMSQHDILIAIAERDVIRAQIKLRSLKTPVKALSPVDAFQSQDML